MSIQEKDRNLFLENNMSQYSEKEKSKLERIFINKKLDIVYELSQK